MPFFPNSVGARSFRCRKVPLLLRTCMGRIGGSKDCIFTVHSVVDRCTSSMQMGSLFCGSHLAYLLFARMPSMPQIPTMDDRNFSISMYPTPNVALSSLGGNVIVRISGVARKAGNCLGNAFLQRSPRDQFDLTSTFRRLVLKCTTRRICGPGGRGSRLTGTVPVRGMCMSRVVDVVSTGTALRRSGVGTCGCLGFYQLLTVVLSDGREADCCSDQLALLRMLGSFTALSGMSVGGVRRVTRGRPRLFRHGTVLHRSFVRLHVVNYLSDRRRCRSLCH